MTLHSISLTKSLCAHWCSPPPPNNNNSQQNQQHEERKKNKHTHTPRSITPAEVAAVIVEIFKRVRRIQSKHFH